MNRQDNQTEDPCITESAPEAGILFVHGLGPTNQGDQLEWAGEPLYNWLRSWLNGEILDTSENDPKYHVWLDDTYLSRPLTDPCAKRDSGTPSHATIYMDGLDKQGNENYRWLMAECWWDADYPQSNYSQIWKWVLGVAPEIVRLTAKNITSQMVQAAQCIAEGRAVDSSSPEPAAHSSGNVSVWLARYILVPTTWLLSQFLYRIVTPVIERLAQVILIVMALPAFIPQIQNIIIGMQQAFSHNWGDGFIIAHSPLSLEAMTTRVQNDVQWLKDKKCKTIAVIAHSGGAAIAKYALANTPESPEVDLFVTYGQAIGKLDLVRKRLKERGVKFAGRMVVRLVGIVFYLGAFGMATLDKASDWWVWVIGLAMGGIIFSLLGSSKLFNQSPDIGPPSAYPKKKKVNQWLDFHAIADPAPQGTLEPPKQPDEPTPIVLIKVSNLDSIPQDHSQYWYNNEQFVSTIAQTVGKCIVKRAGTGPVSTLARLLEGSSAARPEPIMPATSQAEELTKNTNKRQPFDEKVFRAASKKRDIRSFLLMMSGFNSMWATVILWLGLSPLLHPMGNFLATPLLNLLNAHADDNFTDLFSVVLGMVIIAAVAAVFKNLVLFTFWREWSNSETQIMYQAGYKRPSTTVKQESGRASAWSFLVASLFPPAAGLLSAILAIAGNGAKEAWRQALAWYLNGVPASPETLAQYDGLCNVISTVVLVVALALLIYTLVLIVFGAEQLNRGPSEPETDAMSYKVNAPTEPLILGEPDIQGQNAGPGGGQ